MQWLLQNNGWVFSWNFPKNQLHEAENFFFEPVHFPSFFVNVASNSRKKKIIMLVIPLPDTVFCKNKDFSLQKAKELYNVLLISSGSSNNKL